MKRNLILAGLVFLATVTSASKLSAQITTLHSFFGGADGSIPQAGLVQGADGNFYGTTNGGGTNNSGTVFKIAPDGTLTTLFTFNGVNGANPVAGLVQGTDGNFYGTTQGGGAFGGGLGTVFKMTPSGALTTLHSFNGPDGSFPSAGLIQATDGNFYGTTRVNGAFFGLTNSLGGTVFKITPSGALTTLYSFCAVGGSSCTDGQNPTAGLVQGADGNFYGTTVNGGANSLGTVFRITPSGALTTLHSFSGADGAHPAAGLVQGTDGNFYGTTAGVGGSNVGTVFKITPSGTLTTLHSFNGADGAQAVAGLVQATDGNFYGTTGQGGSNNLGTVFKITPGGTLTLLSFNGTDGANPFAGLVQATNGNFYGTTSQGGANNIGTVFRLVASVTATTTLLTSSKNPAGAGDNVTFTATVTSTAGTPTGSVTFLEGSTSLGTQTLSSGQAALTIEDADSLGIGSFSITAQYSPDSILFAASSATITQTVNLPGVALANGSTVLNGNQTVNGTVTATSFVGNGSGLSNLNPASLGPGTAGISITGNAATATLASTASNALNLGGLPPASYQLAGSYALTGPNTFTGNQTITGNLTASGSLSGASGGFTGTLTAGGNVGIGTTLPQGKLHLANAGAASLRIEDTSGAGIVLDITSGSTTGVQFNRQGSLLPITFKMGSNERLRITDAGSVGIGTTTPAQLLDVAGNINASGGVTAGSFTGNGSGLTGVSSTGLNCSGCVGNTQLGIAYAGSATQGGPATSALLAANALALGGIPASGYAPAAGSTVYVAKAGDTMTGDLNLPNLNAGGKVSANGSLVVGNGGTPITEHLSALVNPAFPALHPGGCATANFTLAGAADGDTIALGVPNARMTGGGALSYFAWVSAANTVTVRACNADTQGRQSTPGSGNIRIDLWKH